MTCDRCGAALGREGSILVAAFLEAPGGERLCCADCPECDCRTDQEDDDE